MSSSLDFSNVAQQSMVLAQLSGIMLVLLQQIDQAAILLLLRTKLSSSDCSCKGDTATCCARMYRILMSDILDRSQVTNFLSGMLAKRHNLISDHSHEYMLYLAANRQQLFSKR